MSDSRGYPRRPQCTGPRLSRQARSRRPIRSPMLACSLRNSPWVVHSLLGILSSCASVRQPRRPRFLPLLRGLVDRWTIARRFPRRAMGRGLPSRAAPSWAVVPPLGVMSSFLLASWRCTGAREQSVSVPRALVPWACRSAGLPPCPHSVPGAIFLPLPVWIYRGCIGRSDHGGGRRQRVTQASPG